MPPFEKLTEASLREFGLFGTVILLSLIYLIVIRWKQGAPPPVHPPQPYPLSELHQNIKLVPLALEEIRGVARDIREARAQMGHMEDRLERMEMLSEVIKDRQGR